MIKIALSLSTIKKMSPPLCLLKKRTLIVCLIIPTLFIGIPVLATEGPDASLSSRVQLLEYDGSPLSALRENGLDIDFSVTGFGQKQVGGDGRDDLEVSGKFRTVITLDGQKVGLWSGFFLQVDHEYVAGEYAGGIGDGDGVIIPVNTASSFPTLDGDDWALSINATQAFSESLMISLGTFNAAGLASKTPILGGGGVDTFMNTGFAAPISGVVPPYFAGGVVNYKTENVILTALAYDPGNADDSEVMENLFSDGVTFGLSAVFPIKLKGLSGFQSIKGYYSTQEGYNLENLPQLYLPSDIQELVGDSKNYWYVSYAFQQLLFPIDGQPEKGWGLFFEAGLSDGNPNPIAGHVFGGIGGDSPLPGRWQDKWGAGVFYYDFSDQLKDAASLVNFHIEEEVGVEIFYNFALTPWARITADIQVIDPARTDNNNAIFAGLRAEFKF